MQKFFILVILSALFSLGCSQMRKGPLYRLELKPELNKTEKSQYHSRTLTRVIKNGMLDKKKEEQLDFKIESTAIKVVPNADPTKSAVVYEIKSLDKTGEGSLNEFAFPEPGETIEYTFTRDYEVVEVKGKDKGGVFYIPPMALPKDRVAVGDTWLMKKRWSTEAQAIPLEVELVTIFKEVVDCNEKKCALLEVSGIVKILDISDEAKLDSQISGWALFDITAGTVLWSYVDSVQVLTTSVFQTNLKNCLTSYSLDANWPKLKDEITPYCSIGKDFSREDIPGI